MTSFDLQTALQNLLSGKAAPEDVTGLREALRDGRLVFAEGERSVSDGGDIRGSIVITGATTQFTLTAEALRLLLAESYVPLQIPPKAPQFKNRERGLKCFLDKLGPDRVVTLTGLGERSSVSFFLGLYAVNLLVLMSEGANTLW